MFSYDLLLNAVTAGLLLGGFYAAVTVGVSISFGILDMHGLWFIAGNVIRDVAALNNHEMLPWDVWGAMARTDAELDEHIEATVADTSDDPETALAKKTRNEVLRRALTRLSSEHRQIIDLVYYHEKSVEEAAQILKVPAATVKTRMFYARKKLAVLVSAA